MKIIENTKYDFKDVLIQPKRSSSISRRMIDLNRNFKNKKRNKDFGDFVPLIAANMDHTGTFEMAESLAKHNCMTALHKHYSTQDLIYFFQQDNQKTTQKTFYSLGVADSDVAKLKEVYAKVGDKIKNVCIDVANGYTDYFVDKVKIIRNIIPDAFLMAGNVVTPNMVEELILNAGVNIVKVGIGPGSVCTTRVKTGVGYPQLSAILECCDAAHGLDGFICGDGGCTTPGDVAKAFGAGADFVMLGGMFAGHNECASHRVDKNDDGKTTHMAFHGMSSKEAQEQHSGKMETYKSAEGKEVLVPYRGAIDNTLYDILGGVRSACTYTGAINIKQLHKCTTFVKTTVQENKVFS